MINFLRKLPFLSDFYRYFREWKLLISVPKLTSDGFYWTGYSGMVNHSYEPQIHEYLTRNFQKFNSFVNVGANHGYYLCLVKHLGLKNLVGIEPDRFNLRVLNKNLRTNSFTDVRVIRAAVGDSVEDLEIFGFGSGISAVKGWAGGNSRRVQKVKQIKLGDVSTPPGSTLFLLDVEGWELQVLQGGGQTPQ